MGTATNKPKQQQQQLTPTTTTISNIKLPILKKEEYDIWAIGWEHYLEYIDNDVLEEHLEEDLNGMDYAKEIWEAIRTSSEGLEKGYDRFQQLLLELEVHGAEVSTKDANHNRFSKTDNFKGVPHPLTGDYTPKPQEEIDDSLYVYGKKGPQKPEISDSDDNSTEHYICQSNDSYGLCKLGYYANQFVPKSIQLNAGRPNINSVRPNINTGRTNVNSVRPKVNTGSSNVNTVRLVSHVPTRTQYSFSPKDPQGNWGTAYLPLKNMEDRAQGILFHETECLVVTPDFKMLMKSDTSYRSDNSTEFKNRDMLEFYQNKRIKQEYSNAKTLQQNGVAERMNMTLIEAARTMLVDSLLPTTFWAKAVSTACYIFNRNQTNQHASTSKMTNPNTGTSEVTTSAGTLQTPNANASEEEDEVEDLIIVPTTVRHVGPRKSSTSSKAHEFLTALQNLKTQEKEAYSTGILEDSPEILDFRRELDDLAQNHLREVPKNKANSTNLVNSGSGIDDAQPADQDGSDMPELTIINKLRKDFERPFLCMTMGLVLISKILTTEKQSAATFRSTCTCKLCSKAAKEESQRSTTLFICLLLISGGTLKGLDSSRSTSWIKDEEVYVSQPPSFVDPDHPKKVYKVAKALYGLHQAPRACVKTAITLWRPRLEHIDKKDEELMMLVDVTPKTSHLNAVKRIFKYLKGKPNLGLWYPRESSFDLEAFLDCDYAGANLDRKSITGGHPFEQPSPKHQPSSLRQASDIPQTQDPTHTHEAETGHMSVDDLVRLVPQLMTRIESLEKDLKQTKQTMRNVIVKLVKKVKKMEKGRNLQKDESEVFKTPKQGKSSGETDISLKYYFEVVSSGFLFSLDIKSASLVKRAKLKGKKAQRDKPMTQAQQRQYMATYMKNQGGWKLAQIKKLTNEELKVKFEYLMRSMERFVPMDTEKENWKRTGEELQTESSKR
ncbi:putative ribonuclease H-like domain-containing protein [Tanacetum coccineum]